MTLTFFFKQFNFFLTRPTKQLPPLDLLKTKTHDFNLYTKIMVGNAQGEIPSCRRSTTIVRHTSSVGRGKGGSGLCLCAPFLRLLLYCIYAIRNVITESEAHRCCKRHIREPISAATEKQNVLSILYDKRYTKHTF